MNDVMPGSPEDFGDLKKNSKLRFKARGIKSTFRGRWGETSWGLWNVPRVVESDGKVSIERNFVSLSSCWETFKLKKVDKRFVPEPISYFLDSYMFMNILWTLCLFHVFISWSYFWTWIYYNCWEDFIR